MRTAFVGYIATFLAVLVVSAAVGYVLIGLAPDQPPERVFETLPTLVLGAIASSAVLLVNAVFFAGQPRGQQLGLVRGRASPGTIAVMVVGVIALSQALESLAFVAGVGDRGSLQSFRRALEGASPAMLAMAVLVIGVGAGLAEELFFRGFMQRRLRERWRAGPAVIAVSLSFAVLHLDWVHGALAFGLSLYLGFVTELAGSVVPAVVCHVVNNAVSTVLTAHWGTPADFWTHVALLSSSTVILLVCLVLVRSLVPGRAPFAGDADVVTG